MNERDNFYDCIRAIAAAFVLLRHCSLLPGGAIGVSIFFCLSGFLIARIMLRLPEISFQNMAKFIFRRFMRVWPLMAFQIILTLGLLAALKSRQDAQDYISALPGLLTFTGSVRWIGLSSGILWTLRAEFWFYVLFALAVFSTGRRGLIWMALCGIAIGWVTKYCLGHDLDGMLAASYPDQLKAMVPTFVYLDQLMAGVVCACIVERNNPTIKAIFRNRIVSLWLPLAAITVLATLRVKGYDLSWYLQTSAAAYLTGALLLHQWSNPLKGDYEPLATLGRISFSIYLLHAVVLDFMPWHAFPPALQFLTACGIIVVVSMLTFRWIETPFIHVSRTIAPLEPTTPVLAPNQMARQDV